MASEKYSSLRTTRRDFIRQALCAAVGTAALTNTIRDLRFINAAVAQSASTITDYKALICVFLNGGNDSNNLIIPSITAEYNNYAAIRTAALALPNIDDPNRPSLPLSPNVTDGHNYALHPACPELQSLFNNGKLATIFNVGTLVYPLTKDEYNSGAVAKPPQLFSHADQQQQWQTSIPDRPQATGWGGRCADLMHTYNPQNGSLDQLSMNISLAGANLFEVGGVAQQYNVSTSGVVSLSNSVVPTNAKTAQGVALTNMLGIDEAQANMLTQNYALALDHALASGSTLSTALTGTQMSSYWTAFQKNVVVPNGGGTITNSSFLSQMLMVAKIIETGQRAAASGGLGMKRQIFFVQVGGYDLHTGQTNNAGQTSFNATNVVTGAQASLFAELSQGLSAFQAAMAQIGVQYNDPNFQNRVTAFTASDFGRTFPSNSLGSDHGWGSHHLVLGGAVKGKQTYGKWPALVVGGPDDTNTGRWIPTTSVDQFAATMAKWFGVDSSHMSYVFPNLGRFNTPDLGFMSS